MPESAVEDSGGDVWVVGLRGAGSPPELGEGVGVPSLLPVDSEERSAQDPAPREQTAVVFSSLVPLRSPSLCPLEGSARRVGHVLGQSQKGAWVSPSIPTPFVYR